MAEVVIATAQEADAAAIKGFMARVIAEAVTREEPVHSEMAANTAANVDWWLASPGSAVHLTAVRGGELVGVVLVKDFWNLCSLFVEPALHGQRIGSRLLQAAVDACTARGTRDAILLNAAPRAIPFYARHGFVPRESARPLPAGFAAMQLKLATRSPE